ncbi:Geranylgeranyltransferase_type-2 subunit beta [Hexamita inflata]|uniref:Geranylgeranyl transferase type II subunit beta n=1 Tax=Hexamita inflata TaxID=28002 RepID=A0AA86R412_9EUKA|nr:Geranylgeranyltransferase type-2 subunit beta [Hexamita inflata]
MNTQQIQQLIKYCDDNLFEKQQCDSIYQCMKMHNLHLLAASLDTLGALNRFPFTKEQIVVFVNQCYIEGNFSSYPQGDIHINNVYYCFQLLLTLGLLTDVITSQMADQINNQIYKYIQADGSVIGDHIFHEVDTRFVFSAVSVLSLLCSVYKLEIDSVILLKINSYLESCYFHGQFGADIMQEHHAANTYVCIGSMALIERQIGSFHQFNLKQISNQVVLSIKMLQKEGFAGRPDKLPDSCYSQWCAQTLRILGKSSKVVEDQLISFITSCYDCDGGFAEKKGNKSDLWHTHFCLSWLSQCNNNLREVDPVWDVCEDKLNNIGWFW